MGPPGPPGPRGPRAYAGTIIDPTSSYETYVKYINLRKITLNYLRGIVDLKVNQKFQQHGLIKYNCNLIELLHGDYILYGNIRKMISGE